MELAVHDLGGTGPVLLMCHATGFHARVWEPVAEVLRSEYHCVAFDFRAHGSSTRPIDRPMYWGGMATDVLRVVQAISPGRPVAAVGHSMGGAALLLAETRRPGTLIAAWTYEPILFPGSEIPSDQTEVSVFSEAARRRRAVFGHRDEAFDRYRSRPPLDRLDPRALRAYVDHGFRDLPDGTVTLCCRPEDEASTFEHHRSGAWARIPELTVPYMAATGADDQRPAQAIAQAAGVFDTIETTTYEDLGHFGPLEAPERLAADAAAWLGAIMPEG